MECEDLRLTPCGEHSCCHNSQLSNLVVIDIEFQFRISALHHLLQMSPLIAKVGDGHRFLGPPRAAFPVILAPQVDRVVVGR